MYAADAPRARAIAPSLFVAAVFVSAALVFMVEPMMARLVLPILGGSSAVWNTSLAFFQAALLAGYVYAHLLQRLASTRGQIVLHLGVMALAALALPLGVSTLLGDPPPGAPALWLVGTLTLSIGAPFAALSATAPLVQAWHARIVPGEAGRGPWGLYAASNLGSLLALLAYPIAVEPALSLHHQTRDWSLGYVAFAGMMLVLGAALWRWAPRVREDAAPADGSKVGWLNRARWIALAAIPSSLMLGVTNYVTTDVGSAPFLWVAPLALYLATFIIAFQPRPLVSRTTALVIQAIALPAACAFLHVVTGGFLIGVTIHFAGFFFTALICHQALVARRPAPAHLTDFYICMSLGGALGGAFNAFLAPLIFNTVVEYPAVLVLSCLARPWGRGAPKTWRWLILATGALAAGAAILVAHPEGTVAAAVVERLGNVDPTLVATALLVVTELTAFLLRGRAWMFMAAILILTLAAAKATDRVDVIRTWRGFFGVLRESRLKEPALGGEIHMLAHGTTLHGAQARSPAFRCQPLVYYAHETPIGQVFDAVRTERPAIQVGAVGLGTGSVAAYSRPADSLTFFEIDPLVVRVSTDPRNFSYTTLCARGRVDLTLGDARLTLSRAPAGVFDILLIDAFSSDSVPAHLLTVEAVRMYLTKLRPSGVIILHLSNRNLDLVGPAQAVALAAGGKALFQSHRADPALPQLWESSEDAVIVAKDVEGLAPFLHDPRWRPADAHGVRPWTDDYTNLFGALVRRTRQRWAGEP